MSGPTPGGTMGGRYTLTDRIAAGGMGEVWKAKDDVLGRTVALKVLKAGLTDETGFTDRFRNEARLSAGLTHGNIAQVYDYGEDEGTAYLVMEYVPGRPLSKLIEERAPMSPIDTVEIVAQAASALQAAHKNGLIHRDVKPANILIDPEGTAKLTDFGIARAADAVAMTKTGEVMGTAQYLAPEAAVGKPATGLSDVYALGVVAYEMLAGRRPFEHETAVALALAHVNERPPPLPPFVPPTIRAVVHAALEKDPGRRPQSAAEFGRAMRQALRDADRMGALGPKPQRGPMGSQGPRALSSDQQRQQFSSGPNGPRGGRPAPRSGPQPTGPTPAGPSGPNRGPTSGPQRNRPTSGPQRSGPPPAGTSGPNQARPGPRSGPQPTGPTPAGPSGPNRGPTSGPQRGGPPPAGPSGPNQARSGPRSGPSGPNPQIAGASSGPQPRTNSPASGPQRPVANDSVTTRTELRAEERASSSGPLGLSRNALLGLGGGLVLLVIAVIAIIALTRGGGDSNSDDPKTFETHFTPVSMPTSSHALDPDRSLT